VTKKGNITRSQKRSLKILMSVHVLWLTTICALGAWWGRLVLRQASKIAELEQASGLAFTQAHGQWLRTQRMLFWESGTYFALLIASTIFLFWLYWRDAKRTRSLQAFFASMTHELRTPLTSIRLQAESIADAGPNDAQKLLLDRLLEDTQRLELQVDRVLELSRVEGGGPIFTQSIQARPLLERMIRDWQSRYSQGPNGAVVDLEVQDLQIEADSVAMHVIFKNLLENSIRHSQQTPVKIKISTEQNRDGILVHYRDNGRGFKGDVKSLGKLFEKGEASQGAGVGLYLIQALMKRMGGAAQFSGSPQGLEVSLFFNPGTSGGAHG
jgi:signal transduction histidine kinase